MSLDICMVNDSGDELFLRIVAGYDNIVGVFLMWTL